MHYDELKKKIWLIIGNGANTDAVMGYFDTYLEEKAVEVKSKQKKQWSVPPRNSQAEQANRDHENFNSGLEQAVAIIRNVATKDSLEWEKKLAEILAFQEIDEDVYDNKLIPFIKQQITKAKDEERARIRGVIEKMKRDVRPEITTWLFGNRETNEAHNGALTDILKEIGE